ncbi:sporulation histidine kinase inhibitor Sda [Paenibacillus abyssi]|uniref:Sporulation inhibitor sda n=1 Tax=Paenibacillus abyssi TaxID=1340531 RepID=A0A917FR10_9BACL|nr:sporulation histidine kinase inhibitor Sda [Paenibacillus abyssi]GGF96889.1 hypothetical protein GCM10010916_12670 [Paenibacillus abyssi]
MKILSDEMLVETYYVAVQLKLEPEFIALLQAEIKCRSIEPETFRIGA